MTTKTNTSNLISRFNEFKVNDEFVMLVEAGTRWAFSGCGHHRYPFFPLCHRNALSGAAPTVIDIAEIDENEWEVDGNTLLIDVPRGTTFRTLSEARKWIAESLYQDELGRLRIG